MLPHSTGVNGIAVSELASVHTEHTCKITELMKYDQRSHHAAHYLFGHLRQPRRIQVVHQSYTIPTNPPLNFVIRWKES